MEAHSISYEGCIMLTSFPLHYGVVPNIFNRMTLLWNF